MIEQLLIDLNNEINLLNTYLNNNFDDIKIIQGNICKLQNNIELLLNKLKMEDTIKNSIIYLNNKL